MGEKFTESNPKRQIMKIISAIIQDYEGCELTDEDIGIILKGIDNSFWSNEELWEYLNMPVEEIRESGLLNGRLVYVN